VAGPDHMLFLLMLLLVAPCTTVDGRWVPSRSARSSTWRVILIATSFAIGHSLTLALASLGWLSLPTGPVEVIIAVSVAITAINALRPLFPRSEAWIAGGFGLAHGLAFATLVGDLGLDHFSTVLGFDLGIELAQLAIVALSMPSLYVLSLTRYYPALRIAGGTFGLLAALGWIAERTIDGVSSPLEPLMAGLPKHGLMVAAVLALLAIAAAAAESFPSERTFSAS